MMELTESQRMALVDIVAEYMRQPNATEMFINAATNVSTTTEGLLRALMAGGWRYDAAETRPLPKLLIERANGLERLAAIEDRESPEPDGYCSAAGGDSSRSTAALLLTAAKELADYDASFELYDRAMRALTEAWHRSHPEKRDVLPDTGKLCEWAVERLERLEHALNDCEVHAGVEAIAERTACALCLTEAGERELALREALEAVRDRALAAGEANRVAVYDLAKEALEGHAAAPQKVLTHDEGKDLYAEGLQTGMELGRKLGERR